jgi:tetratricopeptide (TPR) repeat protein
LLFGYLQGGDVARARSFAEGPAELKQIASALEQAGQNDQALEVLSEVAALQPEDFEVRASLAQAYAASGNLGRAREFLDERTAGDNATLWLTLAEIGLSEERLDEGRASVARALSLDAAIRDAVVSLGWRLAERSPEAGYRCIDAVVDRAVSSQDYAAAAAALHGFVIRVPHHLIALMRLVEVCVDGGLETTMYEAQAQLADAYLEVGRGMEARIISEDLVAHEPRNTANIERFRRALVMSGEKDPDGVIAERLSGDSPFLATDSLDLNEGVFFQDVDVATADAEEKPAVDPGVTDAPAPQSDTDAPVQAAAPNALDEVFREMQNVAERESDDKAAAELFGLGVTYQDLGMVDDAIEALQEAARSPRQRFQASVRLGRLYRERGDVARAIEWFERAAESSPSTPDVGRALLYDLAETLENAGEHGRALAVFVELEAESPGYRDVTNRIDRLSTTQAKG